MPRVSILLPNLNNRAFLDERLATIRAQTFSDWELVVVDNHSDDGAWEFFQEAAARDPRLVIAQAPREGMYANWNRCLASARGEFVYVATSDDTMSPNLIDEMVSALEAHTECDLAQCCLHAIDERGNVIPGWWRQIGLARFLDELYLCPHIRRAPYDGVLHCAMHTVYHSITQVLARRRIFTQIGSFPTDLGPGGDFLWGMRAGLHCNVVHVPKFLATWRIHGSQSSAGYRESAGERALMIQMVSRALASRQQGGPAARLPSAPLRFPYCYDHYRYAFAEAASLRCKAGVIMRMVMSEPRVALGALAMALTGHRRSFDKRAYTKRLLRRLGLEQNLVPLPGAATPSPP